MNSSTALKLFASKAATVHDHELATASLGTGTPAVPDFAAEKMRSVGKSSPMAISDARVPIPSIAADEDTKGPTQIRQRGTTSGARIA